MVVNAGGDEEERESDQQVPDTSKMNGGYLERTGRRLAPKRMCDGGD